MRTLTKESAISRFFSHVDVSGRCWLWTGARSQTGYGRFYFESNLVPAHRWIYQYFYGQVPAGKILDHYECSTRSCVNPTHLRPVSYHENALRSETSMAALNLSKTECKRGHLFGESNIIWVGPQKQWRMCKECSREETRQWRLAKKRR